MTDNKKTLKYYLLDNIVLKISVGALITLIIVLLLKERSIENIGYTFVLSTTICWLTWSGNAYLDVQLELWYPWRENPRKRVLYQILINGGFFILTIILTMLLFYKLFFSVDWKEFWSICRYGLIIGLFTTVFFNVLYAGFYFFEQWKLSLTETERLRKEQIQSQFNVLKNQINPHFLFNSLNTLTNLIVEDQAKAIQFVRHFSTVYRHVLTNQQKEVITLKEELKAANAYIELLKKRFEENIKISVAIPDSYLQQTLPPLTLQMLLENAIKHNIIARHKPLKIDVFIENDQIIVQNNLQPKLITNNSTRLGLQNITNRYLLLSNKPPIIKKTNTHFIVEMPLLDVRTNSKFTIQNESSNYRR